jgi:hypothetical protein
MSLDNTKLNINLTQYKAFLRKHLKCKRKKQKYYTLKHLRLIWSLRWHLDWDGRQPENKEQYSRDHSHDHYCHLQFQFRKISFIIQFQISIIIINKN